MTYTSQTHPLIKLLRDRGDHVSIPLVEFEALARAVEHDDDKREALISEAKSYRSPGDLVLNYSNAHIFDNIDGVMQMRREWQARLITVDEALAEDAAIIKARGATKWDGMPPLLMQPQYKNWAFRTEKKTTLGVEAATGNDGRKRTGPGMNCKVNEPETFLLWYDVERLRTSGNMWTEVVGPSFIVTRDAYIVVLDCDPIELGRNIPKNLKPELVGWYIEQAEALTGHIIAWGIKRKAFIQTSRSGKGTHVIIHCRMPKEYFDKYELGYWSPVAVIDGKEVTITIDGKRPDCGHASIFLAGQHIFMTGQKREYSADDVPGVAPEHLEDLIGILFEKDRCIIKKAASNEDDAYFGSLGASNSTDLTTRSGRSTNLTDDALMAHFKRLFSGESFRIYISTDQQGDYSLVFRNLIGDFDKFTGDPNQIYRLIKNSPVWQHAPPDRREKFEDRWERVWLAGCRLWRDKLYIKEQMHAALLRVLNKHFQDYGEPSATPTGTRVLAKAPFDGPFTTEIKVDYLRAVIAARTATTTGLTREKMRDLILSLVCTIEGERVTAVEPLEFGWAVEWINRHLGNDDKFFELLYEDNPRSRGVYAEHKGPTT